MDIVAYPISMDMQLKLSNESKYQTADVMSILCVHICARRGAERNKTDHQCQSM